MSEIDRQMINQFFIGRFSNLHHMYKQAEQEVRVERDERLFADWKEWAGLDEESKQYVRDYLSAE